MGLHRSLLRQYSTKKKVVSQGRNEASYYTVNPNQHSKLHPKINKQSTQITGYPKRNHLNIPPVNSCNLFLCTNRITPTGLRSRVYINHYSVSLHLCMKIASSRRHTKIRKLFELLLRQSWNNRESNLTIH